MAGCRPTWSRPSKRKQESGRRLPLTWVSLSLLTRWAEGPPLTCCHACCAARYSKKYRAASSTMNKLVDLVVPWVLDTFGVSPNVARKDTLLAASRIDKAWTQSPEYSHYSGTQRRRSLLNSG